MHSNNAPIPKWAQKTQVWSTTGLLVLAVSIAILTVGIIFYLENGSRTIRGDFSPEAPFEEFTQDYRPIRVVKPFPALTQFPIKPVKEVKDSLHPAELVLGVVIGKEARAYTINMLTGPQREILNDKLGGRAIAATW